MPFQKVTCNFWVTTPTPLCWEDGTEDRELLFQLSSKSPVVSWKTKSPVCLHYSETNLNNFQDWLNRFPENDANSGCFAGTDPTSGPSPAETLPALTSTPPRILYVYPSQPGSAIPIRLIPISDTEYRVQLSPPPPPPVIRFPLPQQPAYILGELRIHIQIVICVFCKLQSHSPVESNIYNT